MEQKTKFILIGLAGISVVCFFLFVSTLNSKREVMRQRDDLKTENTSLSSKIDKLQTQFRDYENKISSLNNDLQAAIRDRADMENRYNQAKGERDSLAEKLQSRHNIPMPEAAAPQATDAYWGSILKAKTDLEMQLGEIRNQLKNIQINNEELQRQKSSLELDIRNLVSERDDLKRQIDYNQKLSDSIAGELVREKNDKSQIADSFNALKKENLVLTRQIKSLNDKKITLERKVQDLQEEKSSFERRVNEMETMLSGKVGQIGELKNKLDAIRQNKPGETDAVQSAVELPAIVVRPSQDMSSNKGMASTEVSIKGKVLAINRDNNFVVVDLGEESGAKAGDTFRIYRDEKPIASVEVIQVRKTISACDIKRETTPIKIGDTVR
ncbi:MAG: hypothetical protein NT060_05335 [Candidatus Omnitrophica bacterium]|nr:hypothetical protein [Candidatus Omnitrophota bacterium]